MSHYTYSLNKKFTFSIQHLKYISGVESWQGRHIYSKQNQSPTLVFYLHDRIQKMSRNFRPGKSLPNASFTGGDWWVLRTALYKMYIRFCCRFTACQDKDVQPWSLPPVTFPSLSIYNLWKSDESLKTRLISANGRRGGTSVPVPVWHVNKWYAHSC